MGVSVWVSPSSGCAKQQAVDREEIPLMSPTSLLQGAPHPSEWPLMPRGPLHSHEAANHLLDKQGTS